VERDVEVDLTLSDRDLNSFNHASYDDFSNLPLSHKLSSGVECYDIQDDVLTEEFIVVSALRSLLKLEEYFPISKDKVKIMLDSGVIKETKSVVKWLNLDVGPNPYVENFGFYSWSAKNLIEFILLAPYQKPFEKLNESERIKVQKVLDNLKSVRVTNGTLIISV